MALKAQDDCKSDWASLPRELLHNVLAAAAFTPADATRATAANNKRHLPSLADAARLRYAVEASCRSWRASAADFPLRVTLGTSPLPPNATPALLEFLCRRPLAALQFASSGLAGCRPGAVQQLAIDLLASDALAAAAGSCLLEVSVFDYICSRPLCALLPRFPALRCVALSGYSIDIDLEPLQKLPRLESLHIEAEGLPRLDGLPASLRHLSLTCFANAARLLLPPHLRLETLRCHCPLTPIFCALSRAMEVCRSIHLSGRSIHLLLRVDPPLLHAGAAEAVLGAFTGHPGVQQLRLEAPAGRLAVALVPRLPEGAGREQYQVAPFRRGRSLDGEVVCDCVAASGGGVMAVYEKPCPVPCTSTCTLMALLLSKS